MMNVLPTGRHGRRRALPRRAVVVGTTTTMVMAAAGIGYAAWTTQATGSAQARSTAPITATVNVSTGDADLYPGGSGAVYFTVTNPNPYPVVFTSATFGTVTPANADPATGCPASFITTSNKTGLSLSVGAKATSAVLSIPNAVEMLSTAGNGCQSMTFGIAATLTGASA